VADLAEVVGQEAPTDPALHASLAVVAAAIQPKSAFEDADAPFDARPPTVRSSKCSTLPVLLLVRREWPLTG
jgi:hypothetical protein